MTGPYDIYPGVDAGYHFPPEIRAALVTDPEVTAALNASRDDAINKIGKASTGFVQMFAGSTAPSGWLMCDGSAVSRTDYPDLFASIGTNYGAGNGTTTFNLPNLKGKVVAGVDSTQTEFAALGTSGGEKAHKLVVSEMPSHAHVQNAHGHGVTDPGHNHSQNNHGHGISDPGHGHGIYDPGHGHGVADPGHGHGSTTLSGFMTYQTTTATRNLLSTSSGTRYAITSTDINAIGYGSAAGSGTGIGIYGSGTGISINGNGTGVSVNGSTASNNSSGTGVGVQNTTPTEQNAGGDGSHNNLQPYVSMNYIIHI